MTRRPAALLAPLVLAAVFASCASPPAAQAFDPTKPICTLAGLVSTLAGKICSTARHAGTVLKAGQKLLGGHVGKALETVTGGGRAATHVVTTTAALAAMGAWVMGGARVLLRETASVVSSTTRPELQSTWFSATYWRMAGISALLTLPFLFAAAIQALLRSDLALLVRSALGYLPLGFLAVSIAAPLTQLLLAASDEMSSLVSSASGFTTAGFSHFTGGALLASGLGATAFPLFFVGLLTVAAALTLWIELLIRSAAVYVIVLMLPLFFAALVWPARRVWAVRAVELLIALIVSKFAIVAVLALGAAALGHIVQPSATQMLAGTTLVVLAAFTPWAVLRLLPLHELASGLEGLRGGGLHSLTRAEGAAEGAIRGSGDEQVMEEGLGPVDGGPGFAAQAAVENLSGQDTTAAGRRDASPEWEAADPEPGRPQTAAEASLPPVATTAAPLGDGGSAAGAGQPPAPESGTRDEPRPTSEAHASEEPPWSDGMEAPFRGIVGLGRTFDHEPPPADRLPENDGE
jgi:hypothetical protein